MSAEAITNALLLITAGLATTGNGVIYINI